MRKVSEEAQDLLAQLVAWEMLGREDLDAKLLLRQVSLADLSIVAANLRDQEVQSPSVSMVMLELQYRLGNLGGDWSYTRDGDTVNLVYQMRKPLDYIAFHMTVTDTPKESLC